MDLPTRRSRTTLKGRVGAKWSSYSCPMCHPHKCGHCHMWTTNKIYSDMGLEELGTQWWPPCLGSTHRIESTTKAHRESNSGSPWASPCTILNGGHHFHVHSAQGSCVPLIVACTWQKMTHVHGLSRWVLNAYFFMSSPLLVGYETCD